MFDMISAISELINNCQCHGGEGAAAVLMEDQRLEQELLGETGQERRPSPACPGAQGHQGELWASGGVLASPGCTLSRAAQRTGRREVLFRPCGGHVCASPVKGIQGAGWGV